MFKSGHARLLTAFVAAMALHGLLFVWQQQPLDIPASPSMQVEFLAQPHISPVMDMKPRSAHEAISRSVQQEQVIPQHMIPKEVVHKPVPDQQSIERLEPIQKIDMVNTDTKAKPKAVVLLKNDTLTQETLDIRHGEDADMVMPVDIQKRILTRVSYPVRARRLGWEGRAEFRVNVRGQGVQQVTMLLSSGFALLDHAAQKGIHAIASLPLDDGNYSFPVVFRLR